jgi:hypothetical protein
VAAGWLLAGYAGAGGFFVQELFLRRPGTASSVNASHDDEGTMLMLVASSRLACGAAPTPSADHAVGGGRFMGADRAEEYGRRNGVPGELVVRISPTKVRKAFNLAE